MLEIWGMQSTLPCHYSQSTLAWSGSIWKGPIYDLNRTIWHLNWVQTNDLCHIELFEVKLFDHLIMTDV